MTWYGAAVAGPGAAARRPVRQVDVVGDTGRLGGKGFPLGFTQAEAVNAGVAFARVLHEACGHLAARDLVVAGPGAAADPAALDVDPAAAQRFLYRMRELGGKLRKSLAKGQLLDRLRLDCDDPALNFVQDGQTPVLWDMLYDPGDDVPGTADWGRFWGFRRPVSHWVGCLRDYGRIDLRHGLFVGVSDDLTEAAREADWLRGFAADRLRLRHHHTLAGRLWERVRAAVADAPGDPPAVARHLPRCSANWEGWASDVLADILTAAPHELQHFACHGRPGDDTEYLSRLVFRVRDGDGPGEAEVG